MIKQIEITNFKAIGETVTLPIRPITLLFGANSSGKSSILQCLMMLAQSSFDPELTPQGKHVDVGKFMNFIFQHDINHEFTVKFTLDVDEYLFYLSLDGHHLFHASYFDEAMDDKIEDISFGDISKNFFNSLDGYEDGAVSFTFGYEEKTSALLLKKISVFIGSENDPVFIYYNNRDKYEYNFSHSYWNKYYTYFREYIHEACLLYAYNFSLETDDLSTSEESRKYMDLRHKFEETGTGDFLIDLYILNFDKSTREDYEYAKKLDELFKRNYHKRSKKNSLHWKKLYAIKALPSSREKILRLFEHSQNGEGEDFYFDAWLPTSVYHYDEDFTLLSLATRTIDKYVDHRTNYFAINPGFLILLFSKKIRIHLSNYLYIPPIRNVPQRIYMDEPGIESAYMQLLCDTDLLRRVNQELDFLETGYTLDIVTLTNNNVDVDAVFLLNFIDKKTKTRASLKDVGFGFSQILPVIVKSRAEFHKKILIEQPELHLHPAMQAELGDLFIRGAKGTEELVRTYKIEGKAIKDKREKNNYFLLETHSEHLILRILRRIRETTENRLPPNVPPIAPEDIAVLYVQSGNNGAEVVHIPVTEDGEFSKPWPKGFFPERLQELL